MLKKIVSKVPTTKNSDGKKEWLKAWIKSLQDEKTGKDSPQKHLLLLKKWHEKIKKSEKKTKEVECTC